MVGQATGTELYFFAEQFEESRPLVTPYAMNVVLRTTLPAAALAQTLERMVKEVDPTVPIVRLREMDEGFAESISRPRLLAQLVGSLAGLALLLAAVGYIRRPRLHGCATSSRDRHPHGTWSGSFPCAGPDHEAGPPACDRRRSDR